MYRWYLLKGPFLGITVHVKHVPRMLDTLSQMADELSKKESGFNGRTARALAGKPFGEVRKSFWAGSPPLRRKI